MKKLFTIFVFTLFTIVLSAQVSKTINVVTQATLSTLITATEKTSVTNLTITGNINESDFSFLRSMPLLNVLDISKVYIGTYSENGGYYRKFPANQIPGNWQWFPDVSLKIPSQIILPNSITSIGGGAFYNNPNLESIIIPALVDSIGISAFTNCSKLSKVIFLRNTPPKLGTPTNRICISKNTGSTSLPDIYVPIGTINNFKNTTDADIWQLYNIYESILRTTTQPATSITLSTTILNAKLEFISNTPITSYGFCWNISGSPTVSDNKVDNGAKNTIGTYSNSISNLSPATTYYVKAFAIDGERTVYGNEVTFTTASLPGTAGSISGLQTVCQGQNSVTYTVPTIAFATSYTWTLPNGATGTSTTNSISVSYSKTFTSGNIIVKGHNEWGDGATSTLAVTANLLPESAGTISGNTSVCQGESSIVYSVSAINNATSYTWTLPTGATGASTTNSITVNYSKTALSGNITVKGHNDCGDGVVYSLPVTVNQLPVISLTNKTIICGGSVSLSPVISYTGSGTLRYKWTPSTGLSNDTIASPTATISSNITYTLTVNTPTGCTTSANINVTVSPLTANAGTDKTVVCGGTVSLSATTNYTGNGTLKYKWTPATGLNNDSIANPAATVLANTIYTVMVTTPNGCTATDNVAVGIIAMAKPEIGIVGVSGNKNRVVWNKPVSKGILSYSIYRETIISDVYEKVGSVSYDSLSVFVDNQSAPDMKSNKYKLSIMDRSGLESPQSSSHKTMHLSINKGQNNTWNLIWEPYEGFVVSTYNIYRGTTINNLNFLDATSGSSTQYSDLSAPTGDVFYQLEVISPTLVNPTKVPATFQKSKDSENSTLASYSSSRSNIATNLTNGINELGTESTNISIYPNPVRSEFKIDFKEGSTFEMLNLIGQVIYNGNLNVSNVVSTTNLNSGVYLIRFKTGNTFEYRKIIKE